MWVQPVHGVLTHDHEWAASTARQGATIAHIETVQAFSTDVTLCRDLASKPHLDALRALLLAERDTTPGLRVSQVGGWHSKPDLALRADPPIRSLIDLMVRQVDAQLKHRIAQQSLPIPRYRWAVEAWAVVLHSGGYHRLHDHSDSHFSTAFYVDAGNTTDAHSGTLTLVDPARGRRPILGLNLWPSDLDIRPENGLLVVFPGHVRHTVLPYTGDRPRICVAANMNVSILPPSDVAPHESGQPDPPA
ncbi:MAG: hypothetical protein ACI9MC_003941 [Kiritimatiellia bacterium]|jgi:hypothetical protein